MGHFHLTPLAARLRLDFEYGFYCAAAVARMSGGAFMLIVIIISYHFYPRISVNFYGTSQSGTPDKLDVRAVCGEGMLN